MPRSKDKDHPVNTYRKDAITAAKELFYEDGVVSQLKAAKTIGEIERIMIDARKGRR